MEPRDFMAHEPDLTNPYLEQVPPQPVNQKALEVGREVVTAMAYGEDAEAAAIEASEKPVEAIRNDRVGRALQEEEEVQTEALSRTALSSPELVQQALNMSVENITKERERAGSVLAPQRAWIKSLPNSHNLPPQVVDNIAANQVLSNHFAKRLDEQGVGGAVSDFLGLMFVPDMNITAAGIDKAPVEKEFEKADFFTLDNLKSWAQLRLEASAEDKVLLDEQVGEMLEGEESNLFKQYLFIMDYSEEHGLEWDLAFEAGELGALLGSFTVGAARRAIRGMNIVKTLGKAKESVQAMKMADAAKDPELAMQLGIPQADAAVTGAPFGYEKIFTGAPVEVQESFNKLYMKSERIFDEMVDHYQFKVEPTPQEMEALTARWAKEMGTRKEFDTLTFERVEESNSFQAIVNGEATEDIFSFTLNDLGGMDAVGRRGAAALRLATSPHYMASKGDRVKFVNNFEASTYAKGQIASAFADDLDNAVKAVRGNPDSLARIDKMLQDLDGVEMELTYQRLVNEGYNGVRLTPDEFNAVHGIRKSLDEAYDLANRAERRIEELEGIKYFPYDKGQMKGKAYDTPEQAFLALDKEGHVVDTASGKVARGLGVQDIEDAYKEGKVLVARNTDNKLEWLDSAEGKVKYAFVQKSDLSAPPQRVLPKTPNYLPKAQAEGNWFIKGPRTTKVNGALEKVTVTKAWAKTRTEALQYIEKLRKVARDDEDLADLDRLEVVFDRETPVTGSGGRSSGLGFGSRKTDGLPYAGERVDEGKRLDAFEAIQTYMGKVSDRLAMSEVRMEARQRLYNQVAEVPSIGHTAHAKSMTELRQTIKDSNLEPKKKAYLLSMHSQAESIMNIPHPSDVWLQGMIRSLGEKFDDRGWLKTAKAMYTIQRKSPADLVKSSVFNLTLGMYNPAQIFVQGSGIVNAIAINPVYAAKALPRVLAASSLDNFTSRTDQIRFLKELKRRFKGDPQLDVEGLGDDLDFWRQSGIRQSVLQGNADVGAIANGLPYDASTLRRSSKAFFDKGKTPFLIGELANMRTSFFTALARQKDLDGAGFAYDNETLRKVIARAEEYRLNMSAANKAPFQKGVAGIPTQFKQVMTKYYESLLGDWFTGPEKLRSFMAQVTLFGAAGVPILNYWQDHAVSLLPGESQRDPEAVTAARRGVMAWALNEKLDLDGLFTGRVSLSADLLKEFENGLFGDRVPLAQTLMGVSYTTGDRALDFFTNMMYLGKTSVDHLFNEDANPALLSAAVEELGKSALRLPSSTRYAMAAWDLHYGVVNNSKGEKLYEVANPELRDVIVRSLGFASQESSDLWESHIGGKKLSLKLSDHATRYSNLVRNLMTSVEAGDEEATATAHDAISLVQTGIERAFPSKEDRDKLYDMIEKKLNGREFKDKTLRKAIETWGSDLASPSVAEGNIAVLKELEEPK